MIGECSKGRAAAPKTDGVGGYLHPLVIARGSTDEGQR